jgi:hypothetical protein
MNSVITQLLISVGAICTALIAGFFSYLNLVISKEQKISEFRQAWVDSLRQDLARYVASVSYIANSNSIWDWYSKQNKPLPQLELYKLVQPAFDQAVQSYNAIVLRINPSERNKRLRALNNQFVTALREVREALRQDDFETARAHADALHEKLRPILKREWVRVKKGEPIYRTTLWIAAAIFIAGLIALMASLFNWKHATEGRRLVSPMPPEIALNSNSHLVLQESHGANRKRSEADFEGNRQKRRLGKKVQRKISRIC